MTLEALLAERRGAVCRRWLDAVLAEYGAPTAARWRREDPFGNPVGHTLASGLPQLLEAVAAGGETPAGAVTALEAILRIRSVQDLTPSRAVGFVYRLRQAIRDELAAELAGGAMAAQLVEVEGRIERLAWLAFDVYVRLREQIFRLRQEELKRSVASLLRRWHGTAAGSDQAAPPGPAAGIGGPPGASPGELVALSRPPDRGSAR